MNKEDKKLLKKLKRIGKQFLKENNKTKAREIVAMIKEIKAADLKKEKHTENAVVVRNPIKKRKDKLNILHKKRSVTLKKLMRLLGDEGHTLEDKLEINEIIKEIEHNPFQFNKDDYPENVDGLDLEKFNLTEDANKMLDDIFKVMIDKNKLEGLPPANSLTVEVGIPKEKHITKRTFPSRKKPKPKAGK